MESLLSLPIIPTHGISAWPLVTLLALVSATVYLALLGAETSQPVLPFQLPAALCHSQLPALTPCSVWTGSLGAGYDLGTIWLWFSMASAAEIWLPRLSPESPSLLAACHATMEILQRLAGACMCEPHNSKWSMILERQPNIWLQTYKLNWVRPSKAFVSNPCYILI